MHSIEHMNQQCYAHVFSTYIYISKYVGFNRAPELPESRKVL